MYIDEANKDTKPDASINLQKFVLMGDILLMIRNFQSRQDIKLKVLKIIRAYNFVKDKTMDFVFQVPLLNDDVAYERSLTLEPRI